MISFHRLSIPYERFEVDILLDPPPPSPPKIGFLARWLRRWIQLELDARHNWRLMALRVLIMFGLLCVFLGFTFLVFFLANSVAFYFYPVFVPVTNNIYRVVWNPAHCLSIPDYGPQCLTPVKENFSIGHFSVEPDYHYRHCQNIEKFNFDKIVPLLPQLLLVWPPLYNEPMNEFYEHAWDKYGNCFYIRQSEYFSKVLALARQYPIDRWFAESAIRPTIEHDYSFEAFVDVLEEYIESGMYVLKCEQHEDTEKYLLKSIDLCVSDNLIELEHCHRSITHTCPNQILLMPEW